MAILPMYKWLEIIHSRFRSMSDHFAEIVVAPEGGSKGDLRRGLGWDERNLQGGKLEAY